jgi:hypothetical protein
MVARTWVAGGMTTRVVGVAGAAALFLGACQQIPPRGESGGRIGTTTTTFAESASQQVLPVGLMEFADDVTQQLMADLNQVPELNSGVRVTVVFGDIQNKTGIVPTSDFEMVRNRIRSNLMQSQSVLRNIKFVEKRRRIEGIREEEQGGQSDLLQEGASRTQIAERNPEYTFALNGDMFRVNRGNTNLYTMEFNVMRFVDGALVWNSKQYDIKQVQRR